jgi:hypothetical protein
MKLTIFGGSTAAGLGVTDRSFAARIADELQLDFLNLAGSSAQITDSLELVDRAAGSRVVLVMHGSGEALVRPTERSLRAMPKRWRRRGWMDPRAYYSRRLHKRLPQRIESAIRWRIKVFLIRRTGGENILQLDEYCTATRALAERLQALGVEQIVFVGSAALDPRYFPLSTEQIAMYDEATERIAREYGAVFANVIDACDRWDDYFLDHLHPNESGHAKLAAAILAQMRTTSSALARSAESVNVVWAGAQ